MKVTKKISTHNSQEDVATVQAPHFTNPEQSQFATQIRELLVDAGYPAHKQSSFLSKVLGISYPSARRLHKGSSYWTEDSLAQVLSSIGLKFCGIATEPLLPNATKKELKSEKVNKFSLEQRKNVSIPSVITIDGIKMNCTIYESIPSTPPPPACEKICLSFNADGTTSVLNSYHSALHSRLSQIESIKIDTNHEYGKHLVAIVHQNSDFLAKILLEAGFLTESFHSFQELNKRDFNKPDFSAYLLDDSLKDGNSIGFIVEQLRKKYPKTAISVMQTFNESQDFDMEFLNLAQQYNFSILPNPATNASIIRQLITTIRLSSAI